MLISLERYIETNWMDNWTLKEVVKYSTEHKPAARPDDFYAVFLSNVYTAPSCVALASAANVLYDSWIYCVER